MKSPNGMAGALWLAAVCALSSCDAAWDEDLYWPDCDTTDTHPSRTGRGIRTLKLYNCDDTTIDLQNMARYSDVAGLEIESDIVNIIAPNFDCHLTSLSLYIDTQMSWRNLPLAWLRTCPELDSLTYSNVNISDAPDDFIAGTERLVTLELNYGSLDKIPPFFSNKVFSDLYMFSADHNEISNISDPATFANAEDLHDLSLSFNYIEFLHADLFKPLRYIHFIHLNNNRLKYIPEALFQNKQDLNHVDLSHNLIESVAFNAFAGTSINTVLLNDNRLTQLPVNFISNVHSIVGLQEFSFHGNIWDCACLNNILITIKQLGVDYNTDNFDGTHQECFIKMPGLVIQPNSCT